MPVSGSAQVAAMPVSGSAQVAAMLTGQIGGQVGGKQHGQPQVAVWGLSPLWR
jgi:hypothetical protein